ncbi:hypothetical protein Bca4012_015166 [Brassica carinata]
MRFGKEFVSKMIPEWQEAYIDYAHLKTLLQDIETSRKISVSNSQMKPSFARNLTRRYNREASVSESHDTAVNTVEEPRITHELGLLKAGEPSGDSEVVFFRALDQEFNKVNSFYRKEVEKARDEALSLNKQMDALVAFRLRVMEKKHSLSDSVSVDINAFTSEIGSSSKSTEHTKQSVLERIRMNKSRETPLSTIKSILKVHKHEGELRFTRENLKKAEELLQRAFTEFYQKLGHLKNYSFLNTSAISKIMKKYDKIAARNASRQYMEMVDSSYLTSSDEVQKLMLRTESTFIEHFSSSNRSQGKNLLRPKANKERHRITFSTGFFFGCSISLIIALVLIIHARNIMGTLGQRTYMETMFPLYRFFGFVVLHLTMYAANIYLWKIYRVNYSFIFGFKQGTELGYRHVLLLSFGLGTLSLCAVLLNLDMEMDSQTKDYKTFTELIPLFLLAVQALRSLEFYICYYGFGDFRQRRRNTCRSNDVFTTFYFIVAVIPYWLRLLQCIRRIIEEKDRMHGYNAIKYLLTIVAACLRTAYTLNRGTTWNITAWVFSGAATLYATYWDIVVDWGLLQRGCKNSFLRDKLLVPHKTVYYAAMRSYAEVSGTSSGRLRDDGLEVKPGKPQTYDPKNEERKLHLTQATLGAGLGKEKSVIQCSIGGNSPVYLCSLLPNKSECCPLNLKFDDNDETVEFSVSGDRSIHLSGFLEAYDEEECEQDDEEDDSDGIDIGDTESGESEYDSEDDEDEFEDFLDHNLDMYRQSSVPNSGVVIEEIEDEDKPAKDDKTKRSKKKKSQASKDENANKQIIVKESDHAPVLESEDEDGLPLPKEKTAEPEKKSAAKMELDDEEGSSKKRKAKAPEQESVNKNKKKKNQKQKKNEENASNEKADEQVETGNVMRKEETIQSSSNPEAQNGAVSNAMSESSKTPVQSAEKKNKKKKKSNEEAKEDNKAISSRTYPNGLVVEEIKMGKPNGKKATPGKQIFRAHSTVFERRLLSATEENFRRMGRSSIPILVLGSV